ncbi:uncharacterized protein CLUP02_15554 [Colletotrichum lupini]|uniref:Uncharacterized protein n=1 Tax=Colletotrichum lupini TaxID=145971 RepID=A0A9Q8WNE0_9PEZI|nr:uncharacterized protein CLUP02_15554 [Colletotrichum lupini]UQC90023.1 hypothetical protein CLUP02_15554 [Colletotrichum lupini]
MSYQVDYWSIEPLCGRRDTGDNDQATHIPGRNSHSSIRVAALPRSGIRPSLHGLVDYDRSRGLRSPVRL